MPDPSPDPAIEVFGVDDDVWTSGSGSHDRTGSDEIRQGGQGDGPLRTGFARGRWAGAEQARIPLGRGRTTTPGRLVATVAALVVVAFLAGLVVGRAGQSGPSASISTELTFPKGQIDVPGSFFPTEPSFTIQVATPNPLPTGSAGPKGHVAAADVYALELAADPLSRPGQSLERRDAGALSGPWSLIVRRSDGSLGRHSSVLTYPSTITAGDLSRTQIRVGKVIGYSDGYGGIVWPIGGRFARIRGDLGRTQLAAVAARVSVRHGRPVMEHPPTGFRVVASEPYRAPVVAESRYSSDRVDSGPIDGLIYTDVLRCASFEEALFVEGFTAGGNIGGHPGVLTSVGGGTAALAWEPTPGSIVLVAYSGNLGARASTATLVALARGGRLLDHRQWTATHPAVVKGTNSYS